MYSSMSSKVYVFNFPITVSGLSVMYFSMSCWNSLVNLINWLCFLQVGFYLRTVNLDKINREYVSKVIKGDKFHTKFAWSPKLPLKSKSTNWLIWVKSEKL